MKNLLSSTAVGWFRAKNSTFIPACHWSSAEQVSSPDHRPQCETLDTYTHIPSHLSHIHTMSQRVENLSNWRSVFKYKNR